MMPSSQLEGNNNTKDESVQRFVTEIDQCLTELNYTATSGDVESWADIVYESMSAPSRTFHSVQHVFDVAEGADSVQKLAAFFHDVVYYSIDGGLSEVQYEMLKDIIIISEVKIEKEQELKVKLDTDHHKSTDDNTDAAIATSTTGTVEIMDIDDNECHECHASTAVADTVITVSNQTLDANISMAVDMFGFEPGQTLRKFGDGLNEFLSACMAVRCLEKIRNVDGKILASIIACIELTVPFRKPDERGRCPAGALFDRLIEVNEDSKYDLRLPEQELVKIVQRAADLSNRDLANFSATDDVFLSNTWKLLPESNIPLRNNDREYLISEYALALKKMMDFFQILDQNTLYMSFREENEGRRLILKQKTYNAGNNIKIAIKYIRYKLIALAVLAAIAELTGGDAPLNVFPTDHIPDVNTSIGASVNCDRDVFRLLHEGRDEECKFDRKNSPLAAYLYAWMGDEGMEKCTKYIDNAMNEVNAQALLKAIPLSAAMDILDACVKVAVNRTSALNVLRDSLEATSQCRTKRNRRWKRKCWRPFGCF